MTNSESATLMTRGRMVAEGIWRLRAPNPSVMTGAGTNTYFVVGSERVAVIDAGPAIESHERAVLDVLEDLGLQPVFLVSHGHEDHAPLAARLASLLGAEVLSATAREFGCRLQNGLRINLGGRALVALHTPGHSSDHYCFFEDRQGILFSGDHIMEGSTVVIAPPEGDMRSYLESLQMVKGLDPLRLIAPGHGEVIEEPVREIEALVRHRLEREAKVLAALRKLGSGTIGALVPLAYKDVEQSRWPLAALTTWAHLRKLREEGLVLAEDPGDLNSIWVLAPEV
jgi:glyoxylase-like metal-dependent hydrolase (beta-lactamase superfamily II)